MRVLLVSGSTRAGSSNSFVLQMLHLLDHPGVITDLYDGLRGLPAFVPDEPSTPAPVRDLLKRIEAADAVVFSAPEYAGGLPGSLKNLLDHTVGGGELYETPVAWLDVANPGRGHGALAQLRTVLTYMGAHIVEDACTHLTVDRTETGLALGSTASAALATTLAALGSAVGKRARV